jgi:hypothetical protein
MSTDAYSRAYKVKYGKDPSQNELAKWVSGGRKSTF